MSLGNVLLCVMFPTYLVFDKKHIVCSCLPFVV